ncbi:MAG: beta-galactosidase [Acidobacteriota bacterium]
MSFLEGSGAQAGRVLVLEDFELPDSSKRWEGAVEVVPEFASHGQRSGRIRFSVDRARVGTTKMPGDWSAYEVLLFDVYSARQGISSLTLRIEDEGGEYYEAPRKIWVQQGWTHVQANLRSMRTASERRNLSLAAIRRLELEAERQALPLILYVDNFRLVAGEEDTKTASRLLPQDVVTILEGRFFTIRQVARPEDVPESPAVTALRMRADQERELLASAIQAAQLQGIETIYAERHLVTADLGLRVRPNLAWYNNDNSKREMFTYVAESCRRARHELQDIISGASRLPADDDTGVSEALIRPLPPLKGRPMKDGFFLDERGEPMMVLSLHSPSRRLERFFASPLQHIESYSVGGGSRWTIDQSPVYEAFHKYPDTHRVGWDGWCGHLIRDLSSMGVSKRENVVICLESPHIQDAVDKYIRANIPRFHDQPQLLYDIMAYELMYICYCDRSQKMFRDWLQKKHARIGRVNELYGTSYADFEEIVAPPVKNARPLPGTNRALWYDWARFNTDRFTDYLLWVKSRIRQIDREVPLAAGGSSSMLGGHTGTTGIDEERIVNEVDDLIIHEGGGSTLGVDLQLALSEHKKPLADPEMGLRSVEFLLPQFLHGKSVIQIYHWPAQPSNEFHSVIRYSLAHSPDFPLGDISELLRTALDVRRLNKEIAAFANVPADVAIFYSQTSTLQLPPDMLTWATTPYLAELENTYEASQYLDARVTFITERQIRKGWLNRYKLLLIPAARNVPADVVERIWQYAADGGRVLVVPESLLGDEYNHVQDYLARLGIEVQETRRPRPGSAGVLVQGYDQSFSQGVVFADTAFDLKPLPAAASSIGELEGRGVRQLLKADGNAETLFRFEDRSPAVLRVTLGKGAVYVAASSFEGRSYARLLDALFEEARVTRPVRVRASEGTDKWKVEARFAQVGSRRLLYIVNFRNEPTRLRVEAPTGFFSTLHDLRQGREITGGDITLPAHQTAIYEMFGKDSARISHEYNSSPNGPLESVTLPLVRALTSHGFRRVRPPRIASLVTLRHRGTCLCVPAKPAAAVDPTRAFRGL